MKTFYSHLDRFNSAKEQDRKLIEDTIWQDYGLELAVMILDMSGFSLLVQRHGIIHYLGMVRRMQVACEPVVKQFGGQIVKFEADNLFATFLTSAKAVHAAVSINIAINAMNTITPDNQDLAVSIGIGYGRILRIPEHDFFGNEVNLASKLGEDIASPREILLTEAAKASTNDLDFETKAITLNVSGVQITAHKILY